MNDVSTTVILSSSCVLCFSYSFMRTIQWTSHGELWRETVFIDQKKYVITGVE